MDTSESINSNIYDTSLSCDQVNSSTTHLERKSSQTGGEEIFELLGINASPPKRESTANINTKPETANDEKDAPIQESSKMEEISVKKLASSSVSEIPDNSRTKSVKRKSSIIKKETKLNNSMSSDDLDVIFTESVSTSNVTNGGSNATCTRTLRSRTSSLRRMF